MLVIAVDLEVLFQSLVSTFGLSVTLRVVSEGEMEFQNFSKRTEEGGDKL